LLKSTGGCGRSRYGSVSRKPWSSAGSGTQARSNAQTKTLLVLMTISDLFFRMMTEPRP
jgi:hypothetical protein